MHEFNTVSTKYTIKKTKQQKQNLLFVKKKKFFEISIISNDFLVHVSTIYTVSFQHCTLTIKLECVKQ